MRIYVLEEVKSSQQAVEKDPLKREIVQFLQRDGLFPSGKLNMHELKRHLKEQRKSHPNMFPTTLPKVTAGTLSVAWPLWREKLLLARGL